MLPHYWHKFLKSLKNDSFLLLFVIALKSKKVTQLLLFTKPIEKISKEIKSDIHFYCKVGKTKVGLFLNTLQDVVGKIII